MSVEKWMDRKRRAQKWLESEATLRALINAVYDMICVFDAEGELLLSQSRESSLAVPRCTDSWLTAIREEHRYGAMKEFQKIRRTQRTSTIEYQYQDGSNGWIWLESTGMFIEGNGDGYVVILSRDISAQKQREEQLLSLAYCDPLTGLPNRRMLSEHMTRALAYAKRNSLMMGVLYMDVDDFKEINDNLGHEIGDEFLKAFARKVKGCIRDIDTLARIGGDEFVILLPLIDSTIGAERVAERIQTQMASPWQIRGCSFTTSVSMGIAVYPQHCDETESLLRHADIALYQAKHAGGKGYVMYSESMNPHAVRYGKENGCFAG